MKKLFVLIVAVVVFVSCKKDFSCESCQSGTVKVDTILIHATMGHYSEPNQNFVLDVWLTDSVNVDVVVVVSCRINGAYYNKFALIKSGQLSFHSNDNTTPLIWDVYTLDMKILSATPNKGNGWILKY